MNKNNYTPHPIDTKDVALPEELSALAEDIAKNVHEVWSAGRMKDGWTRMEKSAMMQRRSILALCLMKSYQRRKRNTTAIRLLKRLNSF